MTTGITKVRPRSQELLKGMSADRYREAYDEGKSLSVWLEEQDPSSEYNDGLDAFQRLMMAAEIRSKSLLPQGVRASKFGDFDKDENTRALAPEFIARCWRRAMYGADVSTRAIYTSSDQPLNSAMNPYAIANAPRYQNQIAPAIPLDEVVAITTPVDTNAYKAVYLTDSTTDQRMVRVAEATDIPRARLSSSEQTVPLYKYGRVLEQSYETMRRMPLDLLAFHISRLATQAEVDKVAAIIDILVSGDGNGGTAATNYNASTLDSASTGGTLTLKAWLAFKMKFTNPYMVTTALARDTNALTLQLLNTGSANIPLVMIQTANGFGSFRPINPGLADAVALGWTGDAPASAIVAFDARFAIERVVEIGANISEVQRWTTRQTETLTMTETEGYAKIDNASVKTLTLA